MATFYSDYQTAVRAASNGPLHVRAKEKETCQRVRAFRFTYTGKGTEVANDVIILGSLNSPNARVIPETVRVRVAGSGNFDITFRLQKIGADGTGTTHLTNAVQLTQASTGPWTGVAPSAGDLVDIDKKTDQLQLLITAASGSPAFPTGRTLYIEGLYFDEN